MENANWNTGTSEPNNFGEGENCLMANYVAFTPHAHEPGTWNDVACSSKFYFVCEFSGKVGVASVTNKY